MNACDVILDPAETARRLDRPCFLTPDGETTYGEMLSAANRATNAFRTLGIRPDDRILFVLRDTPEMVAAYLGAMKAGAVAVAVNNKLPASDIAFVARHSGARAILADAAFASVLAAVAPGPQLLWCGDRAGDFGTAWSGRRRAGRYSRGRAAKARRHGFLGLYLGHHRTAQRCGPYPW